MPNCSTCRDTGYVCAVCDHADGNCTCVGGPTLVPCPDCFPDDEPADE